MAISKIEFNNAGFKAILQSEGTRELIQGITDEIREKAVANYDAVTLDNVNAEEGFSSKVINGGKAQRWVGFVSTADEHSALCEAGDSVLTRALS